VNGIGRFETIHAGGLAFEVLTAGEGDRLALCLHGFPEHALSWRLQIEPLVALGYRVWAPNQRGYGRSSRSTRVADYAIDRLLEDIAGIIDASGARSTVLVAHDWGGLLACLTIGAFEVTYGLEAALSPSGMKYDYPPAPYFIFGAVALIAATGDVRMLVRGGISGAQRIARHLWRMCFALFIAAASVFLARPQLFPAILQKTGVLAFLSFLPLLLMIFWLIRVWLKNRVARTNRSPQANPQSKNKNEERAIGALPGLKAGRA